MGFCSVLFFSFPFFQRRAADNLRRHHQYQVQAHVYFGGDYFSMPPKSLYEWKKKEVFNEKAEKKPKKPTQNAYLFHPQQISIVFFVVKHQHLRSGVVYFWGAK